MKKGYNFTFNDCISLIEIEEFLFLAVLAVENLHGRARIRLEAKFALEKKSRTCIIESDTEIGDDIARIFTGFLSREFGEGAFKVSRVTDNSNSNNPSIVSTDTNITGSC